MTSVDEFEAVAKAIYAEGAYCGFCDFEGWDSCAACRRVNRDYARAAFAALKGAGDE